MVKIRYANLNDLKNCREVSNIDLILALFVVNFPNIQNQSSFLFLQKIVLSGIENRFLDCL